MNECSQVVPVNLLLIQACVMMYHSGVDQESETASCTGRHLQGDSWRETAGQPEGPQRSGSKTAPSPEKCRGSPAAEEEAALLIDTMQTHRLRHPGGVQARGRKPAACWSYLHSSCSPVVAMTSNHHAGVLVDISRAREARPGQGWSFGGSTFSCCRPWHL